MNSPARDDRLLQFYLPYAAARGPLPASPDAYWPWIVANRDLGEGRYSWTLQTYLQIAATGWPCALVSRFPSDGIIVSHRDFLPIYLRPRPRPFLVCIKPDRKPHPWAHFHVVQNQSDPTVDHRPDRAATVPFWPQPGLLPRLADRADRCETAAYIGRALNLAGELKDAAWTAAAQALGYAWHTPPLPEWHDYRTIDVVVSVRSLATTPATDNPILDPDSKPPSKLVNSWLAGVPAIVGVESSFRHIRQSPLDYLEVQSMPELVTALTRLRSDPQLYRQMVEHGRRRAGDYSSDAVTRRWLRIVEDQIVPAYRAWKVRSYFDRQDRNVRATLRFFANPRNRPSLKALLQK